jgi:hypothetical protein
VHYLLPFSRRCNIRHQILSSHKLSSDLIYVVSFRPRHFESL